MVCEVTCRLQRLVQGYHMLQNVGVVAKFKAPERWYEVISTEFSRPVDVASGILHSQVAGQIKIYASNVFARNIACPVSLVPPSGHITVLER